MRKLKLIILLLALQVSTNAQSYIPFPDTNAIWTLYHYGQTGDDIQKYGMFGDTIINSLTYKKIFWNFDYHFNLSNSYYQGAIREANKKIFVIYINKSTESVLYDFTLNIGDTAKVLDPSSVQYAYKVALIDSININGQYHKRWKFNQYNFSFHSEEYWIEGIGSSFGLLRPLWSGSDNCYNLLCVSRDSSIIYQYSYMPNVPTCAGTIPYDCDGILNPISVPEHTFEYSKSIFYPNPFTNSAILKTNEDLEDATLKVYDILGQDILINDHLIGQEIKITKANLLTGNYYFTLSQGGVLISKGKFIIE
ncbi:MAG: T9SS type A sorting domain-containing protein [Burkholderiales bacterium]|nr:T9SS type A sorting domain-containing protein [Bacteroidia bacterium]